MFTQFSEISSLFIQTNKAKVCKMLTFSSQHIEQKYQYLTQNSSEYIQMKARGNILADFRGGLYHAKISLSTAFSPIFGLSGIYPALNNVKCVKNVLFENYFERFYHFSTV